MNFFVLKRVSSKQFTGARIKTKFDGLSEFVGRRGRMKLLDLLIQKKGSQLKVSEELEVSKSTISGWLNDKKRHPCNLNTKKILRKAFNMYPEETQSILYKELEIFSKSIISLVRRGVN
ncbi:hypothetical protein AKJ50_00710 [candidate division MSBL1 archaeon SCGC-AAA382A13]|uniref:HTH cro/C1-type domain-containing protein n=1 Tax=candidate division MSBL1 archaeon SCGC-AAA382A13 TaxID=1698279 RepID=A0A133VGI5_9EURY|nr:hypothetical protein AKJ50_00710 [candidate division MSBL1 archaeon SCGC-AAA382A13]